VAADSTRKLIDALRAGSLVLLPTDTVYGLAASAERAEFALAVYRLKDRPQTQPTALLAATVDALVECVPEIAGPGEQIARALLPGPYTLVLPNPAGRFPWLAGDRPDAIGVRVPALPGPAYTVVETVGCVLATSANERGGPDPGRLEDVPARIRDAVAAELDVGRLPGSPSTVVDLTGPEPSVIREGMVPAASALARISAATA
jgi:L-threonylcarbamoyladenylate synthase